MSLLKGDFLERLKLVEEKLTSSEQFIAKKLMMNSNTFSKKTISEMAQSMNVSNSTMTRFSRKLGYSGFIELKHALLTMGTNELDHHNELKIQYSLLLNDYTRLMSKFISDVNFDHIKKIAKHLHLANRVIVLGLGSSGNVAQEFSTNLTYLGIDTAMGMDADSILILSRHSQANDYLVFFSNSGTTDCIQAGISFCLENRTPALLITSNKNLNTSLIDSLILPTNHDYISDTFLSNHIPQLFVSDILYRELIKVAPQHYNQSLEATALLFKN